MKNIFTTLILSALFVPALGQRWYSLDKDNSLKHTKESLSKASSLKDILERDPSSLWVEKYSFLSITADCNGRSIKAKSENENFSAEQMNILKNADVNTSIAMKVVYNFKNPVTYAIETATMNLFIPVVPDIEAEFPDGPKGMASYLKENVYDKVGGLDSAKKTTNIELKFTVNEDGQIANTKVFGQISNEHVQKAVLEAFKNMPKWKPAENSNGTKVKQEFRLFIPGRNGSGGC